MIEQKEIYTCKSCNNSIPKRKYCPDCGVYNSGQKATFKTLFSNAISEVLSFEKGLFYNFKVSFTQPNDVVWSYFNGIRNKYAAPGRILLYTLFFLGILYLIDPNFGALDISINNESTSSLTGTKLFLILIIPFLSISSKIVFWKNKGLAVHMLSMIYLFLPRFVITTILITIINLSIGASWSQLLIFVLMIFHTMWTNVLVQKKNASTIQKLGFTILQFLVMFVLIIFFFLSIVVISGTEFIVSQ